MRLTTTELAVLRGMVSGRVIRGPNKAATVAGLRRDIAGRVGEKHAAVLPKQIAAAATLSKARSLLADYLAGPGPPSAALPRALTQPTGDDHEDYTRHRASSCYSRVR